MSNRRSNQSTTKSPFWRDLAFWNLIVTVLSGVVVVIVIQVINQNFQNYLLKEEKSLDKYYATAELYFRRCGFNAELVNNSIMPAFCISVTNTGAAIATDVKITVQSSDPWFSAYPVAVDPPYESLLPRVSENGTWFVYEIPSLPEMAQVVLWIEFMPTEEGQDLSEEEVRELVKAYSSDMFGVIGLSAVCTNCIGSGSGDLKWPPTGVTLPPPVGPVE